MPGKNIYLTLLLVIFSASLLPSCNSAVQGVGRITLADQQLAISQKTADRRIWQTDDLGIHYRLVDNGSTLTISGSVELKDRILNSFPVTVDLKIYVYLLNEEGRATSRYVIRPNLSTYNTSREFTTFSRQIAKDGDTVAIAFSYWGTFRDRSFGARGDVMEWEFFSSPFEK